MTSYLFKIIGAWPSPRQPRARVILMLCFWAARGDRPYYTSIKRSELYERMLGHPPRGNPQQKLTKWSEEQRRR